MKIFRFEDLDVWQHVRDLSRWAQTNGERRLSRDYGLKDRMLRASISIMANFAEGFSRRGDKEFAQFLFVAKSLTAELQNNASVPLDQGCITEGDFQWPL